MKTKTYDATAVLGLPVWLIDTVSEDEEGTIEIARLNTLMASVAVARVLEPARLGGREIRFLRHVLAFTGSEFADALGLSDKSVVSRWETGRARPGDFTEKTIRQLVLNLLGPRAPGVEIGDNAIPGMRIRPRDDAAPMQFALRRRRGPKGRVLCYVPVPRERTASESAVAAAVEA